ncbi:hypothetical protein ABH940_006820 [Streptacidiphilus sp. BW17]
MWRTWTELEERSSAGTAFTTNQSLYQYQYC